MAVWAYACRPCQGKGEWWVSRGDIEAMPPGQHIVRVQAGGSWACATVDRSQSVAIDSSLLRDAVPADRSDCPDCADHPDQERQSPSTADVPHQGVAPDPAGAGSHAASSAAAKPGTGPAVHAAAIALQGRRFLVALTALSVVQRAGEADMLAADLRARFGGVDVVLMGQDDDGTPHYHGAADLLELLADLPVDQMPWKVYGA
jgi:hypothetical protein